MTTKSEVHTIRLRGPWSAFLLPNGDEQNVTLPSRLAEIRGGQLEEGVRYLRHFHRPTGLTENSSVCVSVSADCERFEVRLNQQSIDANPDGKFSIQRYLTPGLNLLEIEISPINDQARLREVRLEISGD